jgi:hypothetical protein
VTRDFDLVIARPGDRLVSMMTLLYDHGLELAARLSDQGEVTSTIASRRVAAVRLRLDAPASACFFNPETGLRIDLLFDFPIAAAELAARANRLTIRGYTFSLACDEDLMHLKKIAKAARSAPGDTEDIAFLESRQPLPPGSDASRAAPPGGIRQREQVQTAEHKQEEKRQR